MAPPTSAGTLDAILAAVFGANESRPLDPGLRRFLERRFRRNLGEVRLHQGPQADRAARALGARAFAFGPHIVFARSEYRPDCPEGVQLLAHEVAHVCQSRGRLGSGGATALGRPGDSLEREAETAAARMATGARMPEFTGNSTPCIRRATFDLGSVDIEVTAPGAIARPFLREGEGRDRVAFHLSRGWNPDPALKVHAFTYRGSIKPLAGKEQELDQFDYGFVQLIRMTIGACTYQGKRPAEGHILIDFGSAVGPEFMLDLNRREGAQPPFYQEPVAGSTDSLGKGKLGDHPDLMVPQTLHNFTTGFDNHLFHAGETLQAFAIFSAKGVDGRFQHFAFRQWIATFNAKFSWGGSQIKVLEDFSSFDSGESTLVARAPRDSDAPGLTAAVGRIGPGMTPVFNDRLQAGMRKAFEQNSFHRRDNAGGFATVPANFW